MRTRILLPLAIVLLSSVGCCQATKNRDGGCKARTAELQTSAEATLAQTTGGSVAGYIDNGIFTYKGIPYAKAERFMPPVPADKWEGVRSCRAYGPTCPQGKRMGWYSDEQAFSFNWNDGFPDEDCLRVNIWTPGINDGKKRPVMVWLHGGGYSAGSGQELPSYDGRNLAEKGDVVVVTLNHRLNVLGFLDLSAYGEKYAHSGNSGLLDLVAALEWVQENIANFGGDASNVTIFGQSGGGGKVSTLLATPAAKGKFHKAIVQSGAMLRTMDSRWSRRIGAAVVEELGITPCRIDEISKVPFEDLLAAGEKVIARLKPEAEKQGFASFIFGWAPTVDGSVLPRQPFSPDAPEQSKDVPMMIGTTIHEFSLSTYVPQLRTIDKSAAIEYLRTKYGEKTEEFLRLFEKTYPDYQPKDLIDTDFTFRPSAIEQAVIKARQGGAPVYTYMFAWESPVLDGILRSTHCMEIPFVFNNADIHASMTGGGKDALELAGKMSQAWINFARTGDPNTEDLPQWPVYNCSEGAAMIFNDDCEVRYNHDKELINFIRQFPTRGF
ncbi:MAG: carboxylesterase/lipase family protein [Bacteroidales bacterium]|nr:carboxylesterase/lipase family protein [Bacteroidales bacterium]